MSQPESSGFNYDDLFKELEALDVSGQHQQLIEVQFRVWTRRLMQAVGPKRALELLRDEKEHLDIDPFWTDREPRLGCKRFATKLEARAGGYPEDHGDA